MRQLVANILDRGGHLLHERTILLLTILSGIGVVCMLCYVSHLQEDLIASTVLQDASLYSQALSEFRTLYTSEIVDVVLKHGIEVTHDHATKKGAIPLPVTLTMLIGKRLGEHGSGAQTRLYSPPTRFPGGSAMAVCEMPLARRHGTLYSATLTNRTIALRS